MVVTAVIGGAACAVLRQPVSVDPAASFAAHLDHGGLTVDRLERGRSGNLRAPSWLRLPGAPTFVLEDAERQRVAALWRSGSEVTVRPTVSEDAPVTGRVRPGWDEGAIRLVLEPSNGDALHTDVFARQGTGMGPSTLTRAAETVIDVRGVYEAPVRDGKGASVGWLRVRVSPYQTAPRIYEAALPTSVPPALAAASAAALDAEIDWIESHATNVYRGSGSTPLERSVPLGR